MEKEQEDEKEKKNQGSKKSQKGKKGEKKKYLVVGCGYTTRFLKEHEIVTNQKLVFLSDYGIGDVIFRRPLDFLQIEEVMDQFSVSRCGTICFELTEDNSILGILDSLVAYHHCGFFFYKEVYGSKSYDKHRLIQEEDFYHFQEVKDQIYYGTLYQCEVLNGVVDVISLRFDTESG